MLTPKSSGSVVRWTRVRQVADHFGQEAFLRLVLLVSIFAWLWIVHARQVRRLDAANGLVFMFVVIGVAVLSYWLVRSHYLWAISIFLAGQLVFIACFMRFTRDLDFGLLFLLPIVTAGSLVGPPGAFVTAGIAALVELRLVATTPLAAGGSTSVVGLICLQFLAAAISGQASLGVHDALQSAEMCACEARKHAQEARRHRGQLQRTLKSLDLAHKQLQRANAELFYAREVADKALRFKADFAAKVSHELRTSLNLILGFSETMIFSQDTYGAELPTAYRRDASEIYRNSRHLLALVDDILDLSKLEAGKLGLRRENVDVAGLLRETTDLVRPLAETKGLALELELPEALPNLELDRTRINQVLLNLLSNATRITSHGRIVVRAVPGADEVIVQVRDTGPGIPAEDLEHVFEEFRQLDNAGDVTGTTGLGLTVSRQIVALHGGRTWAESVPGQGSTFSFALPVEGGDTPATRFSTPSTRPQRSPEPVLVFVGEAESDEAKLLKRHLEGYTLTTAAGWEQARDQVVRSSARAVIVNACLDRVSDPRSMPVPVVACPLPGPQESRQNLKVEGYLQKPLTVDSVRLALQGAAPHAKNLLIVDDNPSAVRLTERMVQTVAGGYRLFRAYSGQQALARIKAQPPDAIILDLVMPNGDGYALISTLRQNPATARIPIIVASGQAVEETWHGGPVSVASGEGFTPTEVLQYLQAILSAIPPTVVERHTTAQPLTAEPLR